IMRDAAGELAHGLHLLGLEERFASFLQLAFRYLPLRHVAGDLRETNQFAGVVADGVDHHVGPEAGAVLAHPPSLGLPTPLPRGPLQTPARHAGLALLLGIEA